ncbi:hypothetical protein [Pseudomonas haemolytica]|uniref:hypothetical protein n=1 Tax=Pseudomonas haemolytica TaxID=2600065 RepID=UPI001909583E|nr:hypothetical protein [Pseudomonas haemolytica]MBK3450817.1 hypothetical protein [Pseudomonas haemolytica]
MTSQINTKQSNSKQTRRKPAQETKALKVTHKPRKKVYVAPTAVPVVEFENPLVVEPVEMLPVLIENVWDYTEVDYVPDDYTKPQQRKRRKHKELTEQYRKESKW